MVATGMTSASVMTRRKPLGEVNVMNTQQQGTAKQPLKAKSSLSNVTSAVEAKPAQSRSQSSHRPQSELCGNEQLRTKVAPAGKEQVCMKWRRGPYTCKH